MFSSVRILGIDPGLRHTGWGVIQAEGARLSYVASGRINTPTDGQMGDRLSFLAEALEQIVSAQSPNEAAVEETFVNTNPRSALKLGQARGICLMAPARMGVPVAEYAANVIKKAIVGAGHADKTQVTAMVARLLPKAPKMSADEADALAVAICHGHLRTSLQRLSA